MSSYVYTHIGFISQEYIDIYICKEEYMSVFVCIIYVKRFIIRCWLTITEAEKYLNVLPYASWTPGMSVG
jgi:hypothetical protein